MLIDSIKEVGSPKVGTDVYFRWVSEKYVYTDPESGSLKLSQQDYTSNP